MRILFAYSSFASFVKRDLKILREKHEVIPRNIRHTNPFRLISDIAAVFKAELVFIWFASFYSLPIFITAKLMRRKIVYVVGGYEAANLPEIGYGSARSPLKRSILRLMLNNSDCVVVVSKSSRQSLAENLGVQGERVKLIYHGFEDAAGHKTVDKLPIVTNVGNHANRGWVTKGIDDFIGVAAAMTNVQFFQIGKQNRDVVQRLMETIPRNLKFCGEIPFEDLGDYLGSAKVYLQLSRHESFGCSVAEAMLHRCIPVVSDAFALPEVVGDCGVILKSREVGDVKKAVEIALQMPPSEGERARQRVLTDFSYERRRDELLKIVDSLGV